MPQKLLPSGHLMELFAPYRNDETRMIGVIERAVSCGFYKNLELGIFFDKGNRKKVRSLLEQNGLRATTFGTPYIKERHLSLCSLDAGERQQAINLMKQLAVLAAEAGYSVFGVPSGDDPGPAFRGFSKLVLIDALQEIAETCQDLGMFLSIEPLDRYAFKKQLIGPIEEAVQWFRELHERCPNTILHWDSAHEALGRIDLSRSLSIAAEFVGQAHLCNAITDEAHPCFGDLHMDVGIAPNYETEGYLTPDVGAALLRQLAAYDDPKGWNLCYVAVEVLGHPGDDLWRKERIVREFTAECFRRAGLL